MQPEYKMIKHMLMSGCKVEDIGRRLKECKLKSRMPIEELRVEEGLLYRIKRNSYEEESRAIVLPPEYSLRAITLAHAVPTAGHGGVKVTLARCQKFAYWPGMKGQVEDFVRKCVVCSHFKKVGNYMPAPLRHYPDVTAPFERLHLDLVGPMGVPHNGYRYVMTVIDVFTRYLVTVALKSKEAIEVA